MMGPMSLSSRQAPPPGPPPSPEYLAEDDGPRLLAVDLTLFSFAMLTVIMRVYVRVFMLKTFGIDDWMMMIAALLSIGCVIIFVKVVSFGMGKHVEALMLPGAGTASSDIMTWLYFYSIFIIFAYSFIKLSIGFFLLRLADRTKWRRFLQGTIAFLVCFTIGSTFAIIFQCNPVRAGWDFSLRPPTGNAKCYPPDTFKNVGVFNSTINIATDLLFALIPIPIVWKLQVNMRTKIGLALILALGLFASATAIYKTPLQYNFFNEPDWSGKGSWYYIWQQVEMNVGIFAACLPTLKPLFANFFGHIKSITTGSNGRTTGLSAGFVSNGYLRQNERRGPDSYAMNNVSTDASRAQESKDRYTRNHRRGSGGGESEESILPIQGKHNSRAIVKTTEVDIS